MLTKKGIETLYKRRHTEARNAPDSARLLLLSWRRNEEDMNDGSLCGTPNGDQSAMAYSKAPKEGHASTLL